MDFALRDHHGGSRHMRRGAATAPMQTRPDRTALEIRQAELGLNSMLCPADTKRHTVQACLCLTALKVPSSSCVQEESQEECFKRQETTAALLTTCYCTPTPPFPQHSRQALRGTRSHSLIEPRSVPTPGE